MPYVHKGDHVEFIGIGLNAQPYCVLIGVGTILKADPDVLITKISIDKITVEWTNHRGTRQSSEYGFEMINLWIRNNDSNKVENQFRYIPRESKVHSLEDIITLIED